MSTDRKLTFAPFIATACALWLAATLTGSQGFTAIITLLAVASLFFQRPSFAFPDYGWALIAALAWITLTSLWSTASGPLFSGTMTGEDFAIDVASIRLIGAAIFSALSIGAAMKIANGSAEKSNTAILIVAGLLAALIVSVFVFREEILAFAYPGKPEKALSDGYQNIQRAANSVAVFLPVGIAALVARRADISVSIAALIFVVSAFTLILLLGVDNRLALLFPVLTAAGIYRLAQRGMLGKRNPSVLLTTLSVIVLVAVMAIVFQKLGSQSAVLSVLLMLTGFALIRLFPANGLKGLVTAIAGYVLFAPILFMALTRGAAAANIRLPESFQARLFGWQETVAKIFDRPITGHGLEASGTWDTTYVARPDWLEQLTALASAENSAAMNKAWQYYPIVPGHPHNMALELWVETGLIGVLLVVAGLLLAARRMPSASGTNTASVYASAGVIGAALPLFSFAYSAWNEAYWAMLAIAACAIIVLSRKRAA